MLQQSSIQLFNYIIHTYKYVYKKSFNLITKMKEKSFIFNRRSIFCLLFITLSLIFVHVHTEPLNYKEFVNILKDFNKSPFVNLLFIYDTATQTGKGLQQYVPVLTQSKKDYYKVHMLDCNTQDEELVRHFPFCSKQFRPKLPALIFTQPNLNQFNSEGQMNEAKQHQYQGQLDQNSLFNFAVPLIKAFSINLKKLKQYQSWSQKYKQVPQILYFTDKQKLPTIYKILTAHFRNTIAFAHVQKGSPLAQHFKITQFPLILLNGKQQIPLSKNLPDMLKRLQVVKGQQSQIYIEEVLTSTIEELTTENIQKLVYELPEHTLVHVVDSNTGQAHPQFKKCQQNFKKMFTYYQASQKIAKQLGVKQFPSIVYFPKSVAKKSVQKTVFTKQNTFRNIYDEISTLIDDFSVPISNDMEMQKLTSIPLQQGKYIAVLFHEQQISLSYRVLSNDQHYKKDIVFFRMKNPDNAVRQKFQIKKLPSLFVMLNDPQGDKDENGKKKNSQQQQPKEGRIQMSLQIAQYNGKFNFDDLSKYFSMFAKKAQPTQQKINQDLQKVNLVEIKSAKHYQKLCVSQNCYLLLLDGRQSKKQNNENYKNQIKKFVHKFSQNVAYVDALCHSEILAPLQIQQQQLPALVYLNSKFQKFSRLVGRIQQKSLGLFITKIKSNKAMYRGYDKISFNDKKNCADQHRKIEQYQKGTSAQTNLSDVQLEIMKEMKQQQEIKKLVMAQLEKQLEKNQKKKRRRRRPKEEEDSEL